MCLHKEVVWNRIHVSIDDVVPPPRFCPTIAAALSLSYLLCFLLLYFGFSLAVARTTNIPSCTSRELFR